MVLGKNREDAEDILVEAFFKVLTNIEQFQGNGSFEGWIRRIIINEALMSLDYKVIVAGANGAHKHIYARRRRRRKNHAAQLLLGHFDTVWPLGTVAQRPFTVDGNIIRGLCHLLFK